MYFVDNQPFEDILDAIDYCKESPPNNLTDENGTVLMRHVPISFGAFKELMVAKCVFDIQTIDREKDSICCL